MSVIPILLVAVAFSVSSATTVEQLNDFFDQAVNTYLSAEIIAATGNSFFPIPNFSHNMQNRTPEGAVINTKVEYYNGNVTGLQLASRRECQQPTWTSANLTAICTLAFSKLSVRYSGLFTRITGHERSVHVLQYPFGLYGNTTAESNVTMSYSPQVGVVSLKSITLKGEPNPYIHFKTDKQENLSKLLSDHFYYRSWKLFQEEIFQSKFKPALERALQKVTFPEKY